MTPKSFLRSLAFIALLASSLAAQEIPITTTSNEARALYLQARNLDERYRMKEALPLYQKAIALDSNFAMAYLNLAFRQTTNRDMRLLFEKALALSEKISEGEQLMIQAAQITSENTGANQKTLWEKLTQLYPNDKRVHATFGDVLYSNLLQPEQAIIEYKKAIALDPKYHPAYNSLGYVYSKMGNSAEAEKALKKYVELLPDEANPHDTYAEVLMKQGKFDESIAEYKKSLALDPKFYFSHVGLGTDYVFTGRGDDGRKQFQKLFDVAFDDNDRLQAITASSKSYLIEGKYDKAIAEQQKLYALAEKNHDLVNMAWRTIGRANLLVEAGKPQAATKELQQTMSIMQNREFPENLKAAVLQGLRSREATVAIASNDLAGAKTKLEEYRKSAETTGDSAELKYFHLIVGRIAIQEQRYADALAELQQADGNNASTLYETARAYAAKGERVRAKEFFARAANFNDMSWEYAFVRKKAKEELAKLK